MQTHGLKNGEEWQFSGSTQGWRTQGLGFNPWHLKFKVLGKQVQGKKRLFPGIETAVG